jgi:CHAT domain-containing protein
MGLAQIASDRTDFVAAERYGEEGLRLSVKLTPNSLGLADDLDIMGNVAMAHGELAIAERRFERGLRLARKLAPTSQYVASILNDRGLLALARGLLEPAERDLEAALVMKERLLPGTVDEAKTLRGLGQVLTRRGLLDRAIECYRRAIDDVEQETGRLGGPQDVKATFRAQHWDLFRELIELLLGKQRTAEAFAVLERGRARGLLDLMGERELIPADSLPQELVQSRRRLAKEYDKVQARMAELDPRRDRAEAKMLAGRLGDLREQSASLVERTRRMSPRFAALKYPQPLDAADAQRALDTGAVMLSYELGKEVGHVFVLARDAPVEVVTLPIGEPALRREIEQLRGLIPQARGSAEIGRARLRELARVSRLLYAQLIAPVASRAVHADRLLIVPDGPLYVLPWGALVTGVEGEGKTQYLVEWKPISVVPSATVLAELEHARSAAAAEAMPVATAELVAFGDPVFPSRLSNGGSAPGAGPRLRSLIDRGFDFAALPASRREVEQIAGLFPGKARVYLGEQATEERARAESGGARYLHFATHATLDESVPLNSAVVLTIPERLSEDRENGLLQAWEIIESLRLKADLVVLSGCKTGLGKELRGEGLLGLTRAFQYAGARSVAASLWSVADQTTADLMVRFYGRLFAGEAKDEALRQAQIELIRGPFPVTDDHGAPTGGDASAPFYWAAFQIYGDWR